MIRLIDVTKKYKDKTIFNKLNLTIKNKGIYFIEGESGCGKSTLLNIIAKFTTFKGKVKNDHLLNMSYVFENSYLIRHLSVKENLDFYRIGYSILDKFNLTNIINNKVSDLSMGEKSRLSYLISMYSNKELVILDEPFSNLDKVNALILIKDILENKDNKIILIVSHIYRNYFIDKADFIKINKGKVDYQNLINKEELISKNRNKLKIDINYLNKEFKYYLKDNFKIYLIIFSLFSFIFLLSYLSSYFINSINKDKSNLLTYNKYYLSECNDNKINNVIVKKCSNPSKEKLDRLVNDKLEYKNNYDFYINSIFNREDLSSFNGKVNLVKGRIPYNEFEVITSDKYKINERIKLSSSFLVNSKKVDIYIKDIELKVVGNYSKLKFFKDDKIYFNYNYLENFLNKEILINNQISLAKYYDYIDTKNYKYLLFTSRKVDYLTLNNLEKTYYLNIDKIYYKSRELLSYLLFYLSLFSLYLIYRFNKHRLDSKAKSNVSLISNSFNRYKSYFYSVLYDLLYITLLCVFIVLVSSLIKINYAFILIYYFSLVSLILTMTSSYFSLKNSSAIMREEVW